MTRFRGTSRRLAIALCWVQGIYFFVTGVWPLISIKTFQAVTGPKTDHLITGREGDHWLVNTVAVLVIAIALVLLRAAWIKRPTSDVALLAIASSAGLVVIDVVYVVRGTIWPIYLLDAVAEVFFIAGWLLAVWPSATGNRRTTTGGA